MPREASVGSRRARGRPRAAPDSQRRSRIIEAARALFVEVGYAGMTTEAVAARCRMSKRTIYEHFTSKTELFGAIVAAHNVEMIALPLDDDAQPLDQALAKIFRVDIDPESDRERHAFVRAAFEQAQFPELHLLIVTEGIEPSRRALAAWLADRRAEGRLAFADADRTARMLMDLMFSATVYRPGSREEWPDPESRRELQRYYIDAFLNGVRPR